MRKTAFTLPCLAGLLLVSACFWARPAQARYYYSWEKKPEKTFHLKTRIRRWQTDTSAQVRSSVLTPSSWWVNGASDISIGQTGDYKVMDAPLYLFSAEVQPFRGVFLDFETGDNRFSKGKYLEHDWLHAPNYTLTLLDGVVWDGPQHRDYAKKVTQAEGTARQYSAALYVNVYQTDGLAQDEEFELDHSLDIFLGYSWYETKVRLFNGEKILSTDFFLPTPPVGPMTGLDSRSRMLWYGWRGGFRERVNLGKNFSAEGKFGFGPALKYRGEAYWNLDTALANPGVRTVATGHVVEGSAAVSYKFWEQFELEGGWMVWAYKAASGRETRHYTDGTTWQGKLNRVKATRKGFFFGLSWKY